MVFDEVFDEMTMNKFLKRECTVKEYYAYYTSTVSNKDCSEWYTIGLCVFGLQSEIGKRVEMYNPKSLLDAYHLARCQETMNDIMRKNSSTSLFSSSKIDQSKSKKGDNVELKFLSDGKGNNGEVEDNGLLVFDNCSDEVKCSKTQLKVSERDDSSKCVGVLDGPCKENKERTSLSNLVPCSSKIIDVPKENESEEKGVIENGLEVDVDKLWGDGVVLDVEWGCDGLKYNHLQNPNHEGTYALFDEMKSIMVKPQDIVKFERTCSLFQLTIVEFDEVTKQGLGDYKIAFEAKLNEKEVCVKGLILRNVYAYKCWNVLKLVQVAPKALATQAAWVKGPKETAGIILMTMDSEIQ
uniref:Uncharacterized protein n=1 Tax=Tanacetum cinerariifolium TaxID=118510 RepID=A0A699GXI4_TANCI|nr:hypothetical protein [Tanacetum cinerariifolium]